MKLMSSFLEIRKELEETLTKEQKSLLEKLINVEAEFFAQLENERISALKASVKACFSEG